MNCRLGPELLAEDPAAFQRHAGTCLDCARLLREKERAYALLAAPPQGLSADRRADLWAGLQAARRAPDRRPLYLGGGAALLAAAALALATVYAPRPAEVAVIVASASTRPVTPQAWVELRPGEQLAIGARAQLIADAPALVWVDTLSTGLELRVAQGQVRLLSVGEDRPLSLRTPTARLLLIGAKARISVSRAGTEGVVESGQVVVERTLGGEQRLLAGGTISAPAALERAQSAGSSSGELAAAPATAGSEAARGAAPAAAEAAPQAPDRAPLSAAAAGPLDRASASAPASRAETRTSAPGLSSSTTPRPEPAAAISAPASTPASSARATANPKAQSGPAATASEPPPRAPISPDPTPTIPAAEPRLSAPKAALQEAQSLLGKDDRRAAALAVEVYQQDVVGPDAGLALCIAADGYRRSGLAAKAAATYVQAAQHANVADEAAYRGATLLHQLGQDDQALAELERGRVSAPRGALAPERTLLEARIHLGRGRALAAASAIERGGAPAEERSVDAGRLEVARALAAAEPQRARALLTLIIARRPAESASWRAAKEILSALQ